MRKVDKQSLFNNSQKDLVKDFIRNKLDLADPNQKKRTSNNAAEVKGSENIQSDKSFTSETNKFVPNNPTGDFHANPSSGNIA